MPPAADPEREEEAEQQQTKWGAALEGLVVGSYCHDVLLRGGRVVGETLGGAAAALPFATWRWRARRMLGFCSE